MSYRFLSVVALAAAQIASAASAAQSADVPGIVLQKQPATYEFGVGDVRVTALSDGTVALELQKLLRGAPPGAINQLLRQNFRRDPVETSINSFLIELPGRRILVDVGSGDLFGPTVGGRLPEALRAAGIRPGQITDILITHVHSDHTGGLMKSGKMMFPNATVHVGGPDVRFFSDLSNSARSGVDKKFWDEMAITMKPYIDAGRVRTFDRTREILPGIRAELRPGHTPGTAIYTLTSKGQSLSFIGDLIHSGAVQFPRPDVTIDFDVDQPTARAVRRSAFDQFARGRSLLAAPHLPFPGVGHIAADRAGYRWFPIDHADRQTAAPAPKN